MLTRHFPLRSTPSGRNEAKLGQKLDEGVPRASDPAMSARTAQKRFPHRFANFARSVCKHSEFQTPGTVITFAKWRV